MTVNEDATPADSIVIRVLDKETASTTLEAVARLMSDAYPGLRIDSPEKVAAYVRELSKSARDRQSHWVVAESRSELVGVEDAFFAPTAGAWTFRFALDGVSQRDATGESDATLRICCADLASLVVGSLSLRSLVRHRLATLEPASMLGEVDRALRPDAPPVCHTRF